MAITYTKQTIREPMTDPTFINGLIGGVIQNNIPYLSFHGRYSIEDDPEWIQFLVDLEIYNNYYDSFLNNPIQAREIDQTNIPFYPVLSWDIQSFEIITSSGTDEEMLKDFESDEWKYFNINEVVNDVEPWKSRDRGAANPTADIDAHSSKSRLVSRFFEPVGVGKVFCEYIWNDLKYFENKNFYARIANVADGGGGIITIFEKVYKTNLKDVEILNPPKLNPGDEDIKNIQYDAKPIYGSSVSFSSRLNYLQTADNSLKLLPSSENSLISKFNFRYLLNDIRLSFILSRIENAEGYKNLQFSDPSNLYKNVIGVVEDYSINKLNANINELNISISSYFKAPIFNWKTSSFLNFTLPIEYSSSKSYKKYEFVYFDPKKYNLYDGEKNKIDNFWFAKEDVEATNNQKFDTTKWTKTFNHESKLPFSFQNKYDFYQLDYKNSFIQNIKHKENANSLKKFEFKLENISDIQCKSILFFLEKKCGYRRFVYNFPFMFSKYRVFVCIDWTHVFKYYDCNDITATFVEDPSVSSNFFKFIDADYYSINEMKNPYPKLLTSL